MRTARALWMVLSLGGCQAFLDEARQDDTGLPPAGGGGGPTAWQGFEDITAAAGIDDRGASYGAGWGDVDGDGDPDLWNGHHAEPASLHLNQGDGTFVDVTGAWVPGVLDYDAHGVAFVDLDNDGRQDLIESVGAEQGAGAGRNRVYHNTGGAFEEVGAASGLGYTQGSGRCPIVYDWNLDGRLDVLLVNMPRADDVAPTALFTQGADGTFALEAEIPPATEHPTALCGQLADLDGDRVMEVVRFGRPSHMTAHDGRSAALDDVSDRVGLPPANRPYDVVIADFTGDGRNDLFLTRWEETSDLAVHDDGQGIDVALRLFGTAEGVRFATEGDVTVTLDPPWFWAPGTIRVGAACATVTSLSNTWAPDDAVVQGRCPHAGGADRGLYVGRVDGVWEVELSTRDYDRGAFVVRSTATITNVDPTIVELDEDAFIERNRDRFFVGTDAGFEDDGWRRGFQQYTQCTSAAALDVDNDMDLDLFLVCSSPVTNHPDRLYLNDGTGRFTLAENHGAEGTSEGRGDTVVVADADGDGFLDLFVTNGYANPPFHDGPVQLFRNRGGPGHWLMVDLVGTRDARDAIGATLEVTAGGVTQVREANGGTHHMGMHHRRLHVGLGAHDVVERVQVTWPDGTSTTVEDVPADQVLVVGQDG